MPTTQSLSQQGSEHHPLQPAGLGRLVHLPVVGHLQSMARVGGSLSHQVGLEGVDDGDIQGSVSATCPVGKQNISSPGFCPWDKCSVLPGGAQGSRQCSVVEEVVSQVVVAGSPLALVPNWSSYSWVIKSRDV